MRFLAVIFFAVALIATAFHLAKPLPSTNFDESFLPKASSVRYVAAGHDAAVAGLFWIKGLTDLGESYLTGREYSYLGHVAELSTSLDSLFYTPYYFISALSSMNAQDTTDLVVMRRGVRIYPENWRMAVSLALRLSRGDNVNKSEAAAVMRPYFDSPDTTIPPHIRTMYRRLELDTMQTEIALEATISDILQPQFKNFRSSFYTRILRILGYKDLIQDVNKDENYQKIKFLVDSMAEGKIHPAVVYNQLLQMKKAEEPAADSTMLAEPAADAAVLAEPAADSTAR